MPTLTIAAVQLRAHDREAFRDVWPGICDRVKDAAKSGASMIVLPEGTIPAYVLGQAQPDTPRIERAIADLRDIARRLHVLVVCGAVRTDASSLYNAAVVIDSDGEIAGYADKTFLWHFDRRWFAPGERIAPIRTSLGTLGVLVCADGRIPTIARALVDAGAEMLVMPTAWVTSGRDPNVLENVQADLLARVRARENGVPFVAANKCGIERNCVAYCGKSQIVAADGSILAIAPSNEPSIISAEINIRATSPARVASLPLPASRTQVKAPVRIAIAAEASDAILDEAMNVIEATHAIVPDSPERAAALDAVIPTAVVDDDCVADPGALAVYRRAGYQLIVWHAHEKDAAWTHMLARSRAVELRMYVVVLDRIRDRAYAVDPDGTTVAGTFGQFRVASFLLDPLRTLQTEVAPGTDVAAELDRVARLIGPEPERG
jgi:predicted amidohydrolase